MVLKSLLKETAPSSNSVLILSPSGTGVLQFPLLSLLEVKISEKLYPVAPCIPSPVASSREDVK